MNKKDVKSLFLYTFILKHILFDRFNASSIVMLNIQILQSTV